MVHPPVVLNKYAPALPAQTLEFAASLYELRRASHHEIGDAVAGELTVEAEITIHLERVDQLIAEPDQFHAEVEFVPTVDPSEILAPGVIAAIERPVMVCAEAETTSDAHDNFGRSLELGLRRGGDPDSGVGITERRAGA